MLRLRLYVPVSSRHLWIPRADLDSKNFERHFQESRHAFGMRALGLPNTKHFHEITRIEDALACACRSRDRGNVANVTQWPSGSSRKAAKKSCSPRPWKSSKTRKATCITKRHTTTSKSR